MEIKKVKISLDKLVSREPNSGYGKITASTINVNILLTQDIKDVGRFIDFPYITFDSNNPTLTYAPIPEKLQYYGGGDFNFITSPGANFTTTGDLFDDNDVRYKNKTIGDYYTNNIIVTGFTEDRLENFASYGYKGLNKFIPGFDLDKGIYFNYINTPVNGVTRVISLNDFNPIIYTEDGNLNDPNLGTELQLDGILFKTYSGETITTINSAGDLVENQATRIYYHGQGVNMTNSTLSALTIEEYLLHITESPKVESDLFIDRGATSVLQNHLQMSEITSLNMLIEYGNGYYNII
jgi:hypothetical protein